MNVATIGIDLAKNVFPIHGVDPHGHAVLRKQLKRAQLFTFFANLPPCLIGMESCCGSHFFARRLEAFGHVVKLMAPQFVKPYVKTNKNDAADAEAICEAVARPNMRFVPAKNMEPWLGYIVYDPCKTRAGRPGRLNHRPDSESGRLEHEHHDAR
jgi:transposase